VTAIVLWSIASAVGAATESKIAFKRHYIDRDSLTGDSWATTMVVDRNGRS